MSEDKIIVKGVVVEICRGGKFRCEIEVGNEQRVIMATPSGKIRKFSIKIVAGDSVDIELSPYDLTKGRIIHRDRN